MSFSCLVESSAANVVSDLPGKHFALKLVSKSDFTMIVPSNDEIIGRFIQSSGTYDVEERDFLLSLINPGSIVVEVGANVGPYSVYLADRLGSAGKLFCFEPFRLLYQVLTANVALNGLSNVVTINSAVGDWPPRDMEAEGPDFNHADNYGASTLLDPIHRTWILSHPVKERIHILPLDSYFFGTVKIDMIKIDAEGMERDVLKGARATLKKFRPLLYIENSESLFKEWMKTEFEYDCYRPSSLIVHNIVICT